MPRLSTVAFNKIHRAEQHKVMLRALRHGYTEVKTKTCSRVVAVILLLPNIVEELPNQAATRRVARLHRKPVMQTLSSRTIAVQILMHSPGEMYTGIILPARLPNLPGHMLNPEPEFNRTVLLHIPSPGRVRSIQLRNTAT
jgi:hypothetical protein